VAAFRKAIEIHPAYLEAHIQLAFTLLSCARTPEALSEFDQVRALTLSSIEEPYRAALDAASRGNLAETAERMRDAFQRRPQSFAYHYHRGLKSLQAGRYEAAAEDLKQAVLFNPRFADVHNYLGVAHGEMGQRPAAIAEFRQAIECNPDYLAARLNLAFTLAEGNEVKEAVCELKAVLSKEPSNQAALSKLEELSPGREEREERMRIP
jgi:tetratricopeptide (TPR) repeat protein